jgi:hypothetical protein
VESTCWSPPQALIQVLRRRLGSPAYDAGGEQSGDGGSGRNAINPEILTMREKSIENNKTM